MNHLALRSSTLLCPQVDYFLVDGSGSMQSKWWQVMAAIENFTKVLRTASATSHGIVSVFSGHDIQMIQRDSLIQNWEPFSKYPLGSTWMGTPLFDAIQYMGLHLRDLAPEKCSIVIITDGDENQSQATAEDAAKVLDWCRAQGWSVTFIGADFNNSYQATLLGASKENSLGVQQALLAEAGTLLAKKRLSGEMEFTDGEKSTFGGYLTNG